MSYIPRNARQLLKNSKLMRDYALKPYGYETPINCNFPKKHPEYKFFDLKMTVHRPGHS
jgi:hypothetical protein